MRMPLEVAHLDALPAGFPDLTVNWLKKTKSR